MKKNKAAFFDRDGTLIDDVGYLSDLNQIKVRPFIFQFCKILQDAGYLIFIVSNQSGIARGFFDEAFVVSTHQRLREIFMAHNICLKKSYYCPHHFEFAIIQQYKKKCNCRKPNPGMLNQAALDFDIDLSKSLMFGDKIADLQAGDAAGCKSFLIQDIDLSKINKVDDIYKLL